MIRKIISYNVNGIRAAAKKGLYEWIISESPDVICLQETKAQPAQIETEILEARGYHCYSHSAVKKGYSGVAIFTKMKPDYIETGIGIDKYDDEGRMIRVDFGDVSVLSVYHPSGTSGDIRQSFKMQWLDDFHMKMKELQQSRPNLIICGDYNIAHTEIDIHNPKGNEKNSGFLPEEREWLTKFLADGFIDTFRYMNADAQKYSWWTYRFNARKNNKGWRIDYNMITESLKEKVVKAEILNDVIHSDHCPITLEIDI